MANVTHRGIPLDPTTGLYDGSLVSFLQAGAGAVETTMRSKVREEVSITDFLAADTDAGRRTAVVAAMTYLTTLGGGTLFFPARAAGWHFNLTGLGAIPWTSDSIIWKGAGKLASTIFNDSTDGTNLIEFDGGSILGRSVQHCGFQDLKIESAAGAGHIWAFLSKGISYSYFRDLWCHQKSTSKAIMYWDWSGTGGHFENRFEGGIYEHGTTNNPATVNAFYFKADRNTFSIISWTGPMRFQCRHSLAPFVYVEKTGSPSSAQFHNVVFRQVNVEQAQRGCFKFLGCEGPLLDKVEFFDSDTVDGHLIECGTSADASGVAGAGRNTEFLTLRDVQFQSGDLVDNVVGVSGSSVTLDTLTQVAGTATATRAAGVPTGLAVGMRVYMSGATQAGYNGRFTVLTVGATTFTYAVDAGTASPATGTPVAALAAMDLSVGAGTNFVRLEGCKSPGSRNVEFDLNSRSTSVTGHSNRVLLFRENDSTSTVLGSGTGETMLRTDAVKLNTLAERTTGDGIDVTGETRFAGEVNANAGLAIGSGSDPLTAAKKFDVASVTWGSVAAGAYAEQDVTCTGVIISDRVSFTLVSTGSNPLGTGIYILPPVVVATDTVRLVVVNTTGSPATPTTRTWRFTVWSHV